MAIKIYTFSTHRADLSPEQYRDHYETKHAPLILSLLGDAAPSTYVRNYITRSNDATQNYPAQLLLGSEGQDLDFDCVCESTFRDRKHMELCMKVLGQPGQKEQREEDEARFLDVAKLKVVVVEVCAS